MSNVISKVRAGVLAAVAAASLGFGATQVFATPAPVDAGSVAVCDAVWCFNKCGGYCSDRGTCICEEW